VRDVLTCPTSPTGPTPAGPNETWDGALGGAVRLIQPRRGFRFSVDAVLLARFAAERPAPAAVDLGCGCGVVALCLLALGGAAEVLGIDLQEEMADRARRAAQAQGWGDRARFVAGDLREVRRLAAPESFRLAVANPPYRPAREGRPSREPGEALARQELAGTLADFVAAGAWLLGTGGELCCVYPARRLAALLPACRAGRLEPKVLRLAHPREGAPASLALLRCVKGAGEGLEVRAPLFLHADGERYSEEARALLGPPGAAGPARPAP